MSAGLFFLPMKDDSSEEVRQQAQAEELTLLVAENSTGHFGVNLDQRNHSASPIRRG